ncbi:MAG: DUF4332 domain-containing protein [Planctomycetes bacterium]|nr:DUF4332 domain-containing protein [Planctomycetota bacterium]
MTPARGSLPSLLGVSPRRPPLQFSASTMLIAAACVVLTVATPLMLRGVEPFATWYYLFAWYSYIALLDAFLVKRGEPGFLLRRPRVFLSMCAWSAVFWFAFELVNLRLRNWYYAYLPDSLPVRWSGTFLAFATVLPGIFGTATVLGSLKAFDGARSRSLRIGPAVLRGMTMAGWLFLSLPLLFPKTFFPLVWGATALLVAPRNYRSGGPCLLRDLERGDPRRLLRLLASGFACGLLWEAWNFAARAKWIYTVPLVGDWRLFEMPVLGFLGFPPFALECDELYRAACRWGVAVALEVHEPVPVTRRFGIVVRRIAIPIAATAVCVVALLGMDRYTVASFTPRVRDLGVISRAEIAELEGVGVTNVFDLVLGSAAGKSERAWIEGARLALFRGIGTDAANALASLGIATIVDLAHQNAANLYGRLRTLRPWDERLRPERVRRWVRDARSLSARERRT